MAFSMDVEGPLGMRPIGEYRQERFNPLYWVAGYEPKTPIRIGSYGTPIESHSHWAVNNGLAFTSSMTSQPAGIERNYLGTVEGKNRRILRGQHGTTPRKHSGVWAKKRWLLQAPGMRYGNLPTPSLMETARFQQMPVPLEKPNPYNPRLFRYARLVEGNQKGTHQLDAMKMQLQQSSMTPQRRTFLERRMRKLEQREGRFLHQKERLLRAIRNNPRLVYRIKTDPALMYQINHNPLFAEVKAEVSGKAYWGSYPDN